MPADSLALAVTTGVGFSVVAGIISGVFYIISQGLAKKRPRKPPINSTTSANNKFQQLPSWRCCVCNSPFLNSEGIIDIDRAVICMRCGRRVCRTRCSTRQQSNRQSNHPDTDDTCSVKSAEHRSASRGGSVCSSTGSSTSRGSSSVVGGSRRGSLSVSGSRRGGSSRTGRYASDGVSGGRKWLCETCRQPEGWLRGLLRSVKLGKGEDGAADEAKEDGNRDWCTKDEMDCTATSEKIYDHILEQQKLERQEIRDFMERLICTMLNGDLDNVSVKRLYHDKKYDAIFNKYHQKLSSVLSELGSALHISMANLPVSGSSPCTAHAALKQMVQQFISDAAVLPLLRRAAEQQLSAGVDDVTNRSYEDLLSAAIINKVIQNGQEEKGRSSVSSISSSRASSSCRNRKRDKLDFDNWPEDDASSVSSSIDGIMHRSASSAGSTKYVDIETLTIRESPGINNLLEPNHRSNSSSLNHLSLGLEDESLEDNWYLQKPGRSATASLVSVPILVPNPNTETEVLIDGKPVDANSDLSDLDSEDEENLESASSLGTILVDAKGIIGGKNVLVEINHEDCDEFGQEIDRGTKPGSNTVLVDNKLIIGVNMIVDKADDDSGHEVIEATNGMLVEGAYDSSLLSLDSNTEQDTEYTERYASLPRTIEKRSFTRRKETDFNDLENLDSGVTSDVEDAGKENLESLKEQNNDHSILFGRDYYIKQASRSSGLHSKNMFEETADEITEVDFPTSPTNDINDSIEEPTSPLLSPTDIIDTAIEITPSTDISGVFTAIPVAVSAEDQGEPAENNEHTEIDTSSSMDTSAASATRPNVLDISSDSDYSIERTYNVMTGEVSKKGIDVVEDAKSPVGIKYIQNGFDEDESVRNEFLKKRSAIKTLICDEVASSPEQIKEVKEMLEQEESPVPYEQNNNNIEDANNKKNLVEEDITPDSLISNDEPDRKDFSLEYSITDHGDNRENVVDQPEIPEEALFQPSCQITPNKQPLIHGSPPEIIRIETNISQAGDSNEETVEIIIPSVKNLRKLFDSQNSNKTNDYTITKRLSTEVKIERKPEMFASEEPVKDIIIIENGKPEEEVKEEEKPIFQSVKNLRKLFDKDNVRIFGWSDRGSNSTERRQYSILN